MQFGQYIESAWANIDKIAKEYGDTHVLSFFAVDDVKYNEEESWIDVYATIPERAMNLIGSTHGGYIAAFLDHWMGVCARSFVLLDREKQGMTTADMQINYLKATKAGEQLRYHIEKCHGGKRSVIVRASVYCGDSLIAIATQNLAILNTPTDKRISTLR